MKQTNHEYNAMHRCTYNRSLDGGFRSKIEEGFRSKIEEHSVVTGLPRRCTRGRNSADQPASCAVVGYG